MDLTQIRYFQVTATRGGLAEASKALGISMPAISKAITKLEEELKTPLFDRTSRKLQLTEQGRFFLKRAEEILSLANKTLEEMQGPATVREIIIAGREVFLEGLILPLIKIFRKKNPTTIIHLRDASGEDAIELVDTGAAHFALTIQAPPPKWEASETGKFDSAVCVSKSHSLYRQSQTSKSIPMKELSQYGFVSPNHPFLGRIGSGRSIDGWRDDLYPRRIEYIVESLSIFSQIVSEGLALGFMPRFWAERRGLGILKLEGNVPRFEYSVFLSSKRAKESASLLAFLDLFHKR